MIENQFDLFLKQLYEQNSKKFNQQIAYIKTYQCVLNDIRFARNQNKVEFVEELIKKITMDFYVYNLFRIYNDEKINFAEKMIVDDIKKMNSEKDVVDYVKNNQLSLLMILSDYYEFHKKNKDYINKVIANTINRFHSDEIFRMYNNFYNNYEGYYQYILSDNIKKGLAFIEEYKENQNYGCISKFLNIEYDDPIERNHFISYILSNVYAYLKYNNITGEQIDTLTSLTEKLNFRMYCFYDNDEFLNYLFKTYYELYKDYKNFNFRDIRDFVDAKYIDIIKKLDNNYKHPSEVFKCATDFSTIDELIEDDIVNYLTFLNNEGYDDDIIIKNLKDVVLGKVQIPNSNNLDNNCFVVNLRALIVSKYYELVNLQYDEVDIDSQELFDEIDSDIDLVYTINLFNDDDNAQRLVEQFYNYLFTDYKTNYDAMNKIIDEDKLKKEIKMNPNCVLDYRKIYGLMLPKETLQTVDLTNDLMGMINNIIAVNYQAHVCEENYIYNEIVQVIKGSCDDYNFTINEMVGFIVSNIYEHLILKNKFNKPEEILINQLENEELDIDDIVENDNYFEYLIKLFEQLNSNYLDMNTMYNLRCNTKKRGKIKVLEKYDPNYYMDKACLDNKID